MGDPGGLSVLWMDEVEIGVLSFSVNHVDMKCRLEGSADRWRLTDFYGHPIAAHRHLSWSLLADLGQRSCLPCLCLGDFNEILSAEEQLGENQRRESQMDGFWEAVNACQLVDIGFVGCSYTWTNNKENEVRCGLDQGRKYR